MKKKVWSGVLPLSILGAMVFGIFILGRIGNNRNEKVLKNGKETIATTLEPKQRVIRVSYSLDGRMYTTGVHRPFSYLHAGEKYLMKYLPEDPELIFVDFTKPILSDNYAEAECVSVQKSFSVINFEYRVEGILYQRETLFRNQTLDKGDYIVKYFKSNPSIGYLFKK